MVIRFFKMCADITKTSEMSLLVGGLVAINFIFPEILGCFHHPNWRTLIIFRGVAPPPTRIVCHIFDVFFPLPGEGLQILSSVSRGSRAKIVGTAGTQTQEENIRFFCQKKCQNEWMKRCQIECQRECPIECQIECLSICQKEGQNRYAIYTSRGYADGMWASYVRIVLSGWWSLEENNFATNV